MFETWKAWTAGQKAAYDADQWRGSTAYMTPAGDDPYWTPFVAVDGRSLDYVALYRTQPGLRMVVDFIAENAAAVKVLVERVQADGVTKALPNHALQTLLDDPSPGSFQFMFLRDLVTDLLLFDITYWRLVRISGKDVLLRMFPDAVTPMGGSSDRPAYYREHRPDGTYVDIPADQVFSLHGYGSRRGSSPLVALEGPLSEDAAATNYRRAMYKNGWRQQGVITRPLEAPKWADDSRRRFLDQMSARFSGSGPGTGKPLLLEEGMTWTADAFDSKSADYISERELNAAYFATFFGVAPELLGLRRANYASAAIYNQQLYLNTLGPLLEFVTQGLTKFLLPMVSSDTNKVRVRFDLDAKLRPTFEEQAKTLEILTFLTPDEKRQRLGLPPLPDGEGEHLATGGGGTMPANLGEGEERPPAPSDEAEPAGGPSAGPESAAEARSLGDGIGRRAAKSGAENRRGAEIRRDGYQAEYEAIFRRTLDRMARSAAGKALTDEERWKRELSADLLPLNRSVVIAEGTRKATQLGGEFDASQIQNYTQAGADAVAGLVSAAAVQAFAEAEADSEDEGPSWFERLAQLTTLAAATTATHLMSFGRLEAGKQNGATTKTWVVTNPRSRHPEMNGASAPLGTPFSNGLDAPGDPDGSADQTAGCRCILDISTEG